MQDKRSYVSNSFVSGGGLGSKTVTAIKRGMPDTFKKQLNLSEDQSIKSSSPAKTGGNGVNSTGTGPNGKNGKSNGRDKNIGGSGYFKTQMKLLVRVKSRIVCPQMNNYTLKLLY
jgi:hypothetical protein